MSIYSDIVMESESDVEQKLLYRLLTAPTPNGLGYSDADFRTKTDIRKISIDKGTKRKLYFPDYAIIVDGLPCAIIEAKTPGEDLNEAIREARLYATEINSSYQKAINPCAKLLATDGINIMACHWDDANPVVSLKVSEISPLDEEFEKLTSFLSKSATTEFAKNILTSIKKQARYYKPVHMLGGKIVINETVGENSFGSNVSLEYKYLFNPDTLEDREAIASNAYVPSRRKQSHVAPIDKIIRASLPQNFIDAKLIEDTDKPGEIFERLVSHGRVRNEICLLVGSVGSGKSTFTDYLRTVALPPNLRASTEWINLNLNKAPLSRDLIYGWVVERCIERIIGLHPEIDFDHIDSLRKVYARDLSRIEKGKASLFPKDSEKYAEIIFNELEKLQADRVGTLNAMEDMLYCGRNKLLIIVLDNCDKRVRDDQLLMFEVATWLKDTFPCMVFLPLRDSTYDQYCNEPPLDTVIKDLVFRIDPPLLEKVIYARLNYALREIKGNSSSFTYYLPNHARVDCKRDEVGIYLKCMIASLFQDPLFKRIVTGLAGRNIRKGLEIFLDFCKSGHISESEIFKIRHADGDYRLPPHLIARIILRGKRKYYSDEQSHLKNLFFSESEDPLPDPFVRISILNWLKEHYREFGPNKIKGFHKAERVIQTLQSNGHSRTRIEKELAALARAGCIISEGNSIEISEEDLVAIAPSGFVHLDLLRNISYLSAVSEDTYFRENQPAKTIANNIAGKGRFKHQSRQSEIDSSHVFMNYMINYYDDYFLGPAKVLNEEKSGDFIDLPSVKEYVEQVAQNDSIYATTLVLETEYPSGTQVEAQIVSIQDYGAFVEFGASGSGLVHKSQFDEFNMCEEGDWVIVEVIGYNTKHKRFDLRLIDS